MSDEKTAYPFTIVDIPDKHKGVVASRDISRGSLVLAEAPLILQPGSRTNESIGKALQGLSKEDQRAYLDLFKHRSKEKSEGVFKDIFDSNCFGLGDDPRGGIFLDGSRFNHSCTPNVHRHWHAPSGRLRFYAIFDIKAGEELCIAYFTIENLGRKERQSKFKEGFGCDCQCETCQLPLDEVTKSDSRREAKAGLDLVVVLRSPRDAMAAILQVLDGLKLDRVEEGITDTYYLAFQVCAKARDGESARIWGQRFLDSRVVMCGSDYDARESTKLSSLIEDPSRHDLWGWGTKTRLRQLTKSWQE